MTNMTHRFDNKQTGTNGPANKSALLYDANGNAKQIPRMNANFGNSGGYRAAEHNRLTSHLPSAPRPTNEELRYGILPCLRARARFIEKNNSYASGALNKIRRRIFGAGFRMCARLKDKKGARLREANNELEDLFKEVSQNFTSQGDSFRVFRTLMGAGYLTDGESIAIQVTRTGKAVELNGETINWSREWQVIDPDQVAEDLEKEFLTGVRAGNRVVLGVEINRFNKPVAYHFYNDGRDIYGRDDFSRLGFANNSKRQTIRIPASQVIHLFKKKYANQVRGIPPLTPVLLNLADLEEFQKATLTTAWIQASFAAFVKSDMPSEMQELINENAQDAWDWSTQYKDQAMQEIQPGMVHYLNPFTDIEFANPNAPTPQFDTFSAACLRAIAAGLDRSFTSVARDLRGVSFSGGRQDEIDDQQADNDEGEMTDEVCFSKIWRDFVKQSVFVHRIIKVAKTVRNIYAHIVQHPVQPWVDPAKTQTSNEKARKNGSKSRVGIAQAEGNDAYDIMDEELDLEEYEAEQRKDRKLVEVAPDPEKEKKNAFQEQFDGLHASMTDLAEMIESKLGQVNA